MTGMITRWALVLLLVGVGSFNAMAQETPETPQTQMAPAESGGGSSEATLADLVPEWVRNLKVSGDLRYRHEHKDDESASSERERHRIRARLNVTGKVNEEIKATFGLATGANEGATSTNQDLDGAFSEKEIWLDLAYFDYAPGQIEGLNVFGGKFKNPFAKVGNSDLLFDGDVRPEGIGGTYKKSLNEQIEFFSAFGGHYVEERSTAADTSLWAIQAGVSSKLPQIEGGNVKAGLGYFDYGNIQGRAALGTDTANFRGNTSVGGLYESDFDLFQAFGEVAFTVAGQPCKVFGDLLINESAESDEDTAYLVGASIGACKKPGSWQFAYNYRDLEADSVVGALVDVTFGGGGTDVKGHKFAAGYQFAKNVKFGLTYLMAERTRSTTTDHDVLIFDMNFKF